MDSEDIFYRHHNELFSSRGLTCALKILVCVLEIVTYGWILLQKGYELNMKIP